jgi:hypothetical protein
MNKPTENDIIDAIRAFVEMAESRARMKMISEMASQALAGTFRKEDWI